MDNVLARWYRMVALSVNMKIRYLRRRSEDGLFIDSFSFHG